MTPYDWFPISHYEETIVGTKLQWQQVIVANKDQRWIRFGRKYPGLNRWYYSTISDQSQWAQVADDDAPTHWIPMMRGPWE